MSSRVILIIVLRLAFMAAQPLRAQQMPDAVVSDPPADRKFPPTLATITVPSHGVDMDATFYLAAGAGPHCTALLLHGVPGYETNGDLAQAIRRAGWNVLLFHYRGTWGISGNFSQSSAIEDVAEAVRFLRDPANAAKYRIDPQSLVVIGHSVGGFLAGYEGSHDPDIRAVAMISAVNLGKINSDPKQRQIRLKRWETQLHPVQGATAPQLFAEAEQHAKDWDYVQWADNLRGRPVLLVAADDQNRGDMDALSAAIQQKGSAALEHIGVETDHSFSDHRIALQSILVAWLEKLQRRDLFQQGQSRPPKEHSTQTKVVLLGTGTPVPDPDHSGPATAIVVGDSVYLVDFGPGVIRRAEAAVLDRGITALEPGNLKVAFATHLHSDHTAGYSDLIFTGWTSGRSTPLEVYGPAGLNLMTEHILEAYRIDIETRTNPEGNQRAIAGGWKVNSHEIKPGVIYKDAKVTVTAFATKHAMESYGYRFDTPDCRIVISGDTSPTEETIKACSGCDVLIHDAQTLDLYAKMPERLHSFVSKYHTTTAQLAALATEAKPKLLVVYHTVAFRPGIAPPKFLSSITSTGASRSTEEILQEEIGSRYSGQFVIGRDLDVY